MLLKNNRFLLLAVTVLESIHEDRVACLRLLSCYMCCQTFPQTYWIAHEFDIKRIIMLGMKKFLARYQCTMKCFSCRQSLQEKQEIKFSHTEWDQLGTKKIRYHFSHLSRNLVSVSRIQCKSFFHPSPPLQVNKKCWFEGSVLGSGRFFFCPLFNVVMVDSYFSE